jgi:hypothetical protein
MFAMIYLRKARRIRVCSLIGAFAFAISGCNTPEPLTPPLALASPYDQSAGGGLWAVAPFVNESGVSIVKSDRIADAFAEQAEQIEGVATIPVNRMLAAMQRLQLPWITSPAEAVSLMNMLGVDGLIVGTVTVYDPYSPPKFGAAVQLWRRESSPPRRTAVVPVALTRARTDHISPGAMPSNEPAAQASGVFDASNHQVLMWLDQYAAGRTEPESAYGNRIYLVSMELYTQFVAYRLLHDLLDSERARFQPPATQPER